MALFILAALAGLVLLSTGIYAVCVVIGESL